MHPIFTFILISQLLTLPLPFILVRIQRKKMNTATQQTAPNFESVWALLQETAQLQKESEARFDRQMRESRTDFDKQLKESRADFDERIKKLDKLIGGISANNGFCAEEYFFNAFEAGQTNFFGEKFDEIEKNIKIKTKKLQDEYDIALYNHTSVAIIEVKYRAHKNDIPKILKKPETFRKVFPDYKDFKIYLGFASMSFYPAIEQECIEQGIAVIKQVGETVVINYKV